MDIQFGSRADFNAGKPGIYRDIPERVYHARLAFSKSIGSSILEGTPESALFKHGHPGAKSADTKFGNVAHAIALRPDDVEHNYAIFVGDRRSTAKKAEWDELVMLYGENYVVREADYQKAVDLVDEVRKKRGLFRKITKPREGRYFELTLLWLEDGVLCKGRLDIYDSATQMIFDPKFVKGGAATPSGFQKHTGNFGYDAQGAWYLRGCAAVGLPVKTIVFVPVEKVEPFTTGYYDFDAESLEGGLEWLWPAFETFKECSTSGRWPGLPDKIVRIQTSYYRKNAIRYAGNEVVDDGE